MLTEHPPAISPARGRHYERIRRRLEGLAGMRVRGRRYIDVDGFDGAAAVILSGSFAPWSAHDLGALARLGEVVVSYGGPVLGICAGMQLLTLFAGGRVEPRQRRELGLGVIEIVDDRDLLSGLAPSAVAYMHHAEDVTFLPEGFDLLARSERCAVEAIAARDRCWWGTQFHPERFSATHPAGIQVLRNFFGLAAAASSLDVSPRQALQSADGSDPGGSGN